MEDPALLHRLEQLGKEGQSRLGERHFNGLITALDRKHPGQGVQVLQQALAAHDPVEELRKAGMRALAEQSEAPYFLKDDAAVRFSEQQAQLYDEIRREERKRRRG